MSDSSQQPFGFQTTQWSLLLAASNRPGRTSEASLKELFKRYWRPLYQFVRRHGRTSVDAEDLVQGFFVQNLKGNTLAVTDRERERFRTFLLALLTNFLRNQHAKEATLKRGGAMRLVSLDLRDESGGLVHQPASLNSSEKEFDPQWAITVLNAVMEAMRMIRSSIVAYLGKRGCDVWEASQPTATHGTLTKLSPGGVCCPMT